MKTFYKTFLVLFIFLLSCEKEEIPPEPILVTLNQNAVAFLKVTPGKYLVYKDSTTLETDSIIITKNDLSSLYRPGYTLNSLFGTEIPACYGDHFEIIYTKKTDSNTSSIWFKGTADAFYQYNYPSQSNIPLKLVDYIDNLELYSGSFYYDEYTIPMSSLTVNGILYENVIKHHTDLGLEITNPYYLKTDYYWAKGLGIIQKSIERTNGVRKTHYLIRHN